MTTDSAAPPEGFKPLSRTPDGFFVSVNGPLYRKREGERFVLGMRVEKRHCNPGLICHGGMLMTFVDMAMVLAANYQGKLGRFLPTINLSADFISAAPVDTWLEARTDLLRVTKNMAFAQCMVTGAGAPVVRASGVFKLGPELRRPDD